MVNIAPTYGKVLPNDQLPKDLVETFQLEKRLFYVLPVSLLNAVQKELPGAIPGTLIEREARLARQLRGDVAIRDTQPVPFLRLEAFTPIVSESDCQCSSNPAAAAAGATSSLQNTHEWSQAYLGWLVQCPQFQSDIARLRQMGCSRCSPQGAPPPYPADSEGRFDLLFRPEHQQAVREVCRKWRLDGFATLDLPIPLEPHFSACSPYNENSRDGGSAPFLPDTYPVKGSGDVLDRIRATQANRGVDHLAEWMKLIAPSSKKSQRLVRLARQFRLQFYWRVIHDRYSTEVARKKVHLYRAFAEFLCENVETIRKEIPKLGRCLDIPSSKWQ